MIAPVLALSVSNTFLKVGALAAFAALLGIAVLALLVFSQARELKRLREWAGRAPERAAELEQRVSAEAAARLQRVGGAVPVPRTTPIVSRAPAARQQPQTASPGSSAPVPRAPLPPATAAAADPETASSSAAATPESTPAEPRPGQPAFVPTAAAGAVAPPSEAPPPGVPSVVPGEQDERPDAPAVESQVARAAEPAPDAARVEGEDQGAQERAEAGAETAREPAATPVGAAAASRVASGASALMDEPPGAIAAPATVAARAAGPVGRSPAPPASGQGVGVAQAAAPARPATPPRPPAQAARGIAGVPTNARAGTPPGGRAANARGARLEGPPFLQEERSAGRTTALIVGGVVFGVAVLVGVLLSLGGGGSHPSSGANASNASSARARARGGHHAHAHTAVVASPAETQVVVLNGTETNGLAHRLSANLQQSGYTQAAALDARPAGRATSVVQYAEGHHAEAQQVAQTLGIGQVSPLEGAVAALVGSSAKVVVIAGADQAALGGGEG